MTKYDLIFKSLEEKVENESLTLEEAEVINKLAFEKYGDVEIEESVDEPEFSAKNTLYSIVNECIQQSYDNGEISLESANELNDQAYSMIIE